MPSPVNVIVLAFDPGKHTGVAFFKAVRASDQSYYLTEYSSITLGPEEHHLQLSNLISNFAEEADEVHIVLERFDFRNGKNKVDMLSRDYIGIIDLETKKLEQAKSKFIFTNRQMPSQGKNFVKDDNLHKLGLWKQGRDNRHEMDAYRHLFWYLIHKAKIMPTEFLRLGWK